MPHIGINAHLLSKENSYRRAGIHVYIAETLRHLPRHEALQYTIFNGDPPDFLAQEQFTVSQSGWRTDHPIKRILWEQLGWGPAARTQRVDLLHSMAFVTPLLSAIPAVVTVYDLSFFRYPERYPKSQRLYLQSQTRRSCRAAKQVITISESGRDDVHHLFDIPYERISVAYPGLSPHFRPPTAGAAAQFRQNPAVPERYILHVGTLQPRKNLLVLLDALAQLRDKEIKLVLIGGKGWFYETIYQRIAELGLENRVIFPGYIPDDDLPLWYHGAELFAFPSVYEGFGMPILEAMACDTPVVSSNASAMPEAAGDAALLCDPHNTAAFVDCLQNVLDNPAQAVTMRERGREQIKKFSWQTTGAQTAEAYRLALRR